ncbi:MAG: hypothetical protein P0S94_02380, partial [Simkaniaceae bacterium]|nr:hypothetical protein [Simkaniaceae bacterium]
IEKYRKEYPGLSTPLRLLGEYLKIAKQVTATEFFSQLLAVAQKPQSYEEEDVKNLIEQFDRYCPGFACAFYLKLTEKHGAESSLVGLAPHVLVAAQETFFDVISKFETAEKEEFAEVFYNNLDPVQASVKKRENKVRIAMDCLDGYSLSLSELKDVLATAKENENPQIYLDAIGEHESDQIMRTTFHVFVTAFDKIKTPKPVDTADESLFSKFMNAFRTIKNLGILQGSIPYIRMGLVMAQGNIAGIELSPQRRAYYDAFFTRMNGLVEALDVADSEDSIKEIAQRLLIEVGSCEQEFSLWGIDLRKWIAPFIDTEIDTTFAIAEIQELEVAAEAVATQEARAVDEPVWEDEALKKKTDLSNTLTAQTIFNVLLYGVTSKKTDCIDMIKKIRNRCEDLPTATRKTQEKQIFLEEFRDMVHNHGGMYTVKKEIIKFVAPLVYYFINYYISGFIDEMYGKVTNKMKALSLDPTADPRTNESTITETAEIMLNVNHFIGITTNLLERAQTDDRANLGTYLSNHLGFKDNLSEDRENLYSLATRKMSRLLPRLDEYGGHFRALSLEKANKIENGTASIGTHLSYYPLLGITFCAEIAEGMIDSIIKYFLYQFLSSNNLLEQVITSTNKAISNNSADTYRKITAKIEEVRQAIQRDQTGEHVEIPEELRDALGKLIKGFRGLMRESTPTQSWVETGAELAEGFAHKQVEAQLIDIIGTAYFQFAQKGTFYQTLSMGIEKAVEGVAAIPCGAPVEDTNNVGSDAGAGVEDVEPAPAEAIREGEKEPGAVMRSSIHRLIRVAVTRALDELWRAAPAKQRAANKLLVNVHSLFDEKSDDWNELIENNEEQQDNIVYQNGALERHRQLIASIMETTQTWVDLTQEASHSDAFNDNNKIYFNRLFDPLARSLHSYYRVPKPGPNATTEEKSTYYERVEKMRPIVSAAMKGTPITSEMLAAAGITPTPEESTSISSTAIELVKTQKHYVSLLEKEHALSALSTAISATKAKAEQIKGITSIDALNRHQAALDEQIKGASDALIELRAKGVMPADSISTYGKQITEITKQTQKLIDAKKQVLVLTELKDKGHLQELYNIRMNDLPKNVSPGFTAFVKNYLANKELDGFDPTTINSEFSPERSTDNLREKNTPT